MERDRGQAHPRPLPDTRQELTSWVRETIPVPSHVHDLLLQAVDRIFVRHEQLWQASKQDAMRAMSQGFADQLARLRHQLAAKETTVTNISEYFENLVSSLNEKAGRDAKTNLLNFPRFEEALTILLATERRVSRCAVGLIDIARFKWYNDTCGHMVGDRIIETVSMLLRKHMRDRDLVAKEPDADDHAMHARFGGDEFCFLIADVADVKQINTICRRFSEAVSGYDWIAVDSRLAQNPVRVDIGVACLDLGALSDRRLLAPQFAKQLIEWGDTAMYRAKADPDRNTQVVCLQISGHELVATDATTADAASAS
jgi:diguanylate cyclase (GGDEF)-like protein